MHAQDPIRSALRWSALSVGWTLLASGTAIGIGLLAGSLSLVAFGAVGLLDAVGSIVLVWHFRQALHHEHVSHARDRTVLVVIATGMVLIAVATAATAIVRLLDHATIDDGLAGVLTAAPSVVALGVLGTGKRRAARRVVSHALLTDGLVSLTGMVFALVVLAGFAAESLAHWWWFDPIGSVLIAIGAVGLAMASLRPH